MRRNKEEVEQLVIELRGYLCYTDRHGNHLNVRDLAKLLNVSKSRVAQLMKQLDSRYAYLLNPRKDDAV